MKAGGFDRRIEILRGVLTVNAFNEKIRTFATIATVWAMVVPVNDGERRAGGQTLATRQSRFTIRWSSAVRDITPVDRLRFDGRVYDIDGVKELARREGLEITATARVD